MKVLLVEDDVELVKYLRRSLQASGYVTEWADNGIDGEFLASEESFDAMVLDLGLPEKSGLDVLKSLRSQDNSMPILILTARDAWQERVDGLKAGADDYLGKPFQLDELLARLEALIRRSSSRQQTHLTYRGFQLDQDRQCLISENGESKPLTAIEFRLLRYLLRHPNQLLSKTRLSEHVYEEEQIKDSNVIEVYINRLRHILGKSAIKTHRGQGYQLVDEE